VLLRRILPTISATKVDQSSEEGAAMLADLNIKALPAYIFSKEIEETDFYLQAQQLFEQFGDKYVLKTAEAGIQAGKYIELPQVGEEDIKIGPDGLKLKCPANHPYNRLNRVLERRRTNQTETRSALRSLPSNERRPAQS